MQHQFFVRFDYPDVIPSKLNLGAVAFISPYDGSVLSASIGAILSFEKADCGFILKRSFRKWSQ